jgi:YkyB-like protein
MIQEKHVPTNEGCIEEITQAIFIVNRHAKSAPNPKYLYLLKKKTIQKLLEEGKAEKVGLHFSNKPKLCQQRSDVLVQAGNYFFHIPPSKEDFKSLPHLGELNTTYRNPKTIMRLSIAKKILQNYTGIEDMKEEPVMKKQKRLPFLENSYLSGGYTSLKRY